MERAHITRVQHAGGGSRDSLPSLYLHFASLEALARPSHRQRHLRLPEAPALLVAEPTTRLELESPSNLEHLGGASAPRRARARAP